MKKLITIIILACALAVNAGVQIDPQLTGGTNNVPANTTNTYASQSGSIFWFGRTTDQTFAFTFNCGAASTANYTIGFDGSEDGIVWKTNALLWMVAGNGVSTNTFLTNLAVGQRYPFYRVGQIWNTNASTPAISNILVKVFAKDGI
jgi:hypothetical protein